MGANVATPSKYDGIEVVVARTGRTDFASFYEEHYRSITKAIWATIRDKDLAAEATDEAMARAYASWAKVQRYDNPAGWVYRVGVNWAISALRKRNRRAAKVDPTPPLDIEIGDPSLHAAIGKLDTKMRSVVVCRYLLDWTTEQTAEALSLREGTVKSRLHRALQQLSQQLGHLKDTA